MMRGTQKLFALFTILTLLASLSLAQSPAKQNKQQTIAPSAAGNPVIGSGSTGQITKWTGVDGSNTYTVGNSNIFEDKFGKIGIGTTTPISLLTIQGMVETTLGGYKFPDGTIQTTAGLAFVTHDASLMGDGRIATPLGIALGGVNTIHLANNAVTAPKIANGTVVRSLNGLFDNLSLAAGANITITPSGNTLTIASPNSLTSVAHDSTLSGNGTSGSPLGVANSGIGNTQLAENAVTSSKIASGHVVKNINGLTDGVNLTAGSNITITPSGNGLTIAGTGSSVAYNDPFTNEANLDPPGILVASKMVPAGSYIIFFKINLENFDDDPQTGSCNLSTGDVAIYRLGGFGEISFYDTLVLHQAVVFPTPTTISAYCVGFNVIGQRQVLTALKVDSIQ